MKRLLSLFALIFLSFSFGISETSAQNPDITSFSTSFTSIGRQALENRTARIPVTWTSSHRPLTANLYFEQVFADGSTINVELPRLIPFVASNGNGIAAPILPSNNASEIVLRVTLKNIFNQQIYDTAEIRLAIVEGNGGAGESNVPTITVFTTNASSVDRVELNNGNVRIPVSWTAINRPVTANLVFEQILPDGSAINVELPRPFQWVNSSDAGIVAPVAPSSNASEIILRLRLVDLLFNRVLDQKFVTIPIQSNSTTANISRFETSMTNISADVVRAGNARIDVAWEVQNRPDNSNLVFEQVLPDGSVRNAELPRDVVLVPSSGNGVVAPIMPNQATDHLIFQVRLVNLSNGQSITSARIEVPMLNSNEGELVVVTANACYHSPFPASQGLAIGGQARVQQTFGSPDGNSSSVSVYSDLTTYQIIGEVEYGDVLSIEEGPYCSYFNDNGGIQRSRRRWNIIYNGLRGWVDEYFGTNQEGGFGYNFVPVNNADIPTVEIVSFIISPNSVDASALDSTYITFSWQTRNASRVYISELYGYGDLPTSGELQILAGDLDIRSNPYTFNFTAQDRQQNYDNAEQTLTINSSVSISSFTVSPETARANNQVSFSWNIIGDFETASIYWSPNIARPSLTTVTNISSNTGNFTFTLPDYVSGTHQFTLRLDDRTGAAQSSSISVNITCAYDWGMSISDADCPRQALVNRQAAYQSFQRGFMVWLPVLQGQELWVFYNDGTTRQYGDSWNGAEFTIEPPAPEGLISPERGFGYLWNNTPEVRSALGWAIAEEQAYTAQFQQTLSAARYSEIRWYISLPDGRIIKTTYNMSSPTLRWTQN